MSERSARQRRLRLAALAPTVALAAAGLATAGTSGAATAASTTENRTSSGDSYSYINYVAPQVEKAFGKDVAVTKGKNPTADDAITKAMAWDAKHAQGNPVAARELAKLEAKAIKTGKSPKELKAQRVKSSKSTETAKLLTILVEFSDEANDDFTDVMVPSAFGSDTCELGTVQNGPLHNNIPNPADAALPDNNSMWVADFSSEHYNKMLYTKDGITERVRTDLTGPDGKPGFDISGYTMKNMYEEMSKGAYSVDGAATPWVTVDHSEGWYGATRCYKDPETGEYVYDRIQDQQGHPDNPLGAGQLPIDAVTKLAEMDPEFPWSDYDIEDQGDRDGDGNYLEPDGIIDHVVLVHAGEDKSGGGGAQGPYAIWAHSSDVTGGAPIPGTDLKVSNYIVQPEDSGVGVFAHEYGHDLGLPDLYDTSGAADSDVDFWDLMSSGSHSGPIFQSMPTHMGLWDKWVLGWADPQQINPGADPRDIIVGQTSNTPKGTKDGIKVNLPQKVITLATPHSGSTMWYSGADQNWAKVDLRRTVDVPDASDAKFWMWNNYVIEEDWDFGFVEVSTDGGSSWTQVKVYDETGALVSTGDDYADPYGRMTDYGNKKYGLSGDSHGWRHDYVDLSAYAGQSVQVRLQYSTDAGYLDRGWFADDFALTGGGSTTWSDDVEGGANGWTANQGTYTDTTGAGWYTDSGTQTKSQYYLVEWRNLDGFDKGLKYAYDTTYSVDGAWKVEKLGYNAPGALVWYRDTTWGNQNHVTANLTSLPSAGAKGGLLIVDSHFDPLRRTGSAADVDPTQLNNLPSRPQSSNAAFGLVPTKAFTECIVDAELTEHCTDFAPQAPVSTFTDAKGWTPGIEYRPGEKPSLVFRDEDASAVVPSKGNAPYTTRIVYQDGSPATGLFGANFGWTIAGTGNPADSGVAYNTVIEVKEALQGNTAAKIHVVAPTP